MIYNTHRTTKHRLFGDHSLKPWYTITFEQQSTNCIVDLSIKPWYTITMKEQSTGSFCKVVWICATCDVLDGN